ncbi:MAG: NUDIX hydrolase [Muribaculaceae bacterium]|nr:NUDIX hydrolase [Muribaculaceae bacterium]
MEQQNSSYTYRYPHPAVTTDCVVFGFDGVHLNVLLVERGNEPHKGSWAFPGGFLNIDEDAPDGARRELLEETGMQVTHMEQLGAFTRPDRDPRERVISIAYFALVRVGDVAAGDDAACARWFPINRLPELAFDHQEIFERALKRMSHFLKLKTGDFVSAEFSYEEIDTIYYLTLTQ